MSPTPKRVIAVAPLPPEKCAYALARYSRSPDSIRESLEWVRTHNSQSFLESFYFQYGHASIADLGHTVICLEGISELAAAEAEDEVLWDGQAKSSRYQDFSRTGFLTPPEFHPESAAIYKTAAEALLAAYQQTHAAMLDHLRATLPRPETMKPEAYERNINARAFDVARYLLFWGVPTNVGQVTSIRTLEKQIRRLRASLYAEVRALGEEIREACGQPPECRWRDEDVEPIAPTLARHAEPDFFSLRSRADLQAWATQNLPKRHECETQRIDLLQPTDASAEIAATLLYPVTDRPFRELYHVALDWSTAQRREVIDVGLRSKGRFDEMPRGLRGGQFIFDMAIDLGAYRDMHRHRRCHQYRQAYTGRLGFDVPAVLEKTQAASAFRVAMDQALATLHTLPSPGAHYLMPFGARSRFLFKMDFAEVEYISRVRSGVKGHFSYREIAWEMKQKLAGVEPSLAELIDATPPWVEDPLKR